MLKRRLQAAFAYPSSKSFSKKLNEKSHRFEIAVSLCKILGGAGDELLFPTAFHFINP